MRKPTQEEDRRWERQFRTFVWWLVGIWTSYFLLMTCTGCGRATPGYVHDKTDKVFVPYMEAFGNECAVPFISIRIGFGLYDEKKAGICMTYSKQEMLGRTQVYEEILINEVHWQQYNEDKRKWLIFHEMGHCALGKEHSEDKEDIMYYEIPAIAVITQEKLDRLCH